MINIAKLNMFFQNHFEELKEKSRIVYYKGNENGFNDNIYTCDDLLHDCYFSLKTSAEKNLLKANDDNHLLCICYLRMKTVYFSYLKKKWSRSRTENDYFTKLGYKYKAEDLILKIFETYEKSILNENVSENDILDIIENFDNEEQKIILKLKCKHVTNEKLRNYLGYEKSELRSKIYYSRKKLFKQMQDKKILNDSIKYEDVIGRDSEKTSMFSLLDQQENYYDDYPFDASYRKKVTFILQKNDGKIDIEKLRLLIKINEGKSLKQDSRNAVNNSIQKNIAENKCYISENYLLAIKF